MVKEIERRPEKREMGDGGEPSTWMCKEVKPAWRMGRGWRFREITLRNP